MFGILYKITWRLFFKINYIFFSFSETKESVEYESTEKIVAEGKTHGSLLFQPVLKIHEGNYICEANNGVGTPLISDFSIFVHGRNKKRTSSLNKC